MVADSVHLLIAVATLAVVTRTARAEPYLAVLLAASFPDFDIYLFGTLLEFGVFVGPTWSHRGVTHSLFALLLLVALASRRGYELPVVVGYGTHLLADALTGGIRLFAPVSPTLYGIDVGWYRGNLLLGGVAVLVLLSCLVASTPRLDADGERTFGFEGFGRFGD